MKRRSFLGLLGMSPIAAPVAMREAAAMSGIRAMPLPTSEDFARFAENAATGSLGEHVPWFVERLQGLYADDAYEKALADVGRPSLIDPDLAGARSFSLSAVIQMQRHRDATRRLDRARRDGEADYHQKYGAVWSGFDAWLKLHSKAAKP